MGEEGIDGQGEVGDEDPFNAATDAIAEHGIDEIIVSTLPATESAWLRRDLIASARVRRPACRSSTSSSTSTGGLPFEVTLVLANQTAAGGALVERLEELAAEGPHRFIVVVPAGPHPSRRGRGGPPAARTRCSSPCTSPTSSPPGRSATPTRTRPR